jgi:hypothetical protein
MPEIAVTADDLARLGEELDEVRAFLVELGRVSGLEPWAFGAGGTGDALAEVLGNWERHRLLLGRHLETLSEATRAVGGAYVHVEAGLTDAMGGPVP